MKNKFIPVALSAAILALVLACTNPANGDPGSGGPTPRDNLISWFGENLPNVDVHLAYGSYYDDLRELLAIEMEGIEAFVNHNLGTLDIVLGATAAHTTPGATQDTLRLPGDNATAAAVGMGNYISAIAGRWPNHLSANMHAGMIPQNTR